MIHLMVNYLVNLITNPPIDVLKKGNDKLKCSVVGSLPKGGLPFGRVSAYAHRVWDKQGLLSVFQKDDSTFIFKFDSDRGMNNILARGTWYIGRAPLLVHPWGFNPCSNSVKSIPLWIKFEKVPDCYWTAEGLSNIASVIGKPLGTDDLTSKLEVLPFAKICVEYTIGKELPNKIEVMNLNPMTEKLNMVEVKVTYPNKPLMCSGCKAVGHVVGACPITTRHWVKKVPLPAAPADDIGEGVSEFHGSPTSKSLSHPVVVPLDATPGGEEHGWETVPPKKSFSPASAAFFDTSPSPLNTFKNLAQVDEIDAKRASTSTLPKSQRFKRSKASGKPSSQSS